jgi:antitoxin (DNA-binding transcriptional repressor) of toxin-antitoxin stability system
VRCYGPVAPLVGATGLFCFDWFQHRVDLAAHFNVLLDEARSVFRFNGTNTAFDTLCETCYAPSVKTITIRDLRQRWPEAEAALELEGELLVTRDSKPVARLVRVVQPETRRTRWSPEEHRRWIKKTFGKKVFGGSEQRLDEAREDRKLT